tara:strand:+ start:531 stop:632 length:102 start_codon:yes stop_codon:yes gene_type:complete
MTPEETEEIIRAATAIYLNLTEEDIKQMTLSQV